MAISIDDVHTIANLAHLHLEDAKEAEKYQTELSSILAFVEQLQGIDTNSVPAMAHPIETSARLRQDQVSEQDKHEKFQTIAPQTEAGLYLVPKVID